MSTIIKCFIYLLLAFGTVYSSAALDTLKMNSSFKESSLQAYLEYRQKKEPFKAVTDHDAILSLIKDTTIFRFLLKNESPEAKNITFWAGNIHTLYVSFFADKKNIFELDKTHYPSTQTFSVPANHVTLCQFKVYNGDIALGFTPKIYTQTAFLRQQNAEAKIDFSVYGILLFIIAIACICYYKFKKRYILNYIGHIFSFSMFLFLYEGNFLHYFSEERVLHVQLYIIFSFLGQLFYFMFLSSFLELNKHSTVLFNITKAYILATVVLVILNMLPNMNNLIKENIHLISTLINLSFPILTIAARIKKIPRTNYFLLSVLFLTVMGVIGGQVEFGKLPEVLPGNTIMKLGMLGDAIIIGVGIISVYSQKQKELTVNLNDQLVLSESMNENLKKQQEENIALTEIKDHFITHLSHEIKTPINGLIGSTQLLKSLNTNTTLNEYISKIETSGFTLKEIIDDILTFKLLTRENLVHQPSVFSLEKTLREIVDGNQAKFKSKNIVFEVINNINTSEFSVLGDRYFIKKCLNILLDNAAKFTHQGSVLLKIDIQIAQKDATFSFLVTDTGVGIAKEEQIDIFSPFVHRGEHNPYSESGIGLGLAVFERMVNAMNGVMHFKSAPKKGTSIGFDIALPILLKNTSGTRQDTEYKVLVVEDNDINQFIALQLFKKSALHLDIKFAKNGKEAVDMAINDSYNIIFMDLQMPLMDGYEATSIIRSLNNDRAKTPIIALTAYSQQKERIKCKSVGMNDFIAKPYKIDDIDRVISTYSGKNRSKSNTQTKNKWIL